MYASYTQCTCASAEKTPTIFYQTWRALHTYRLLYTAQTHILLWYLTQNLELSRQLFLFSRQPVVFFSHVRESARRLWCVSARRDDRGHESSALSAFCGNDMLLRVSGNLLARVLCHIEQRAFTSHPHHICVQRALDLTGGAVLLVCSVREMCKCRGRCRCRFLVYCLMST